MYGLQGKRKGNFGLPCCFTIVRIHTRGHADNKGLIRVPDVSGFIWDYFKNKLYKGMMIPILRFFATFTLFNTQGFLFLPIHIIIIKQSI